MKERSRMVFIANLGTGGVQSHTWVSFVTKS